MRAPNSNSSRRITIWLVSAVVLFGSMGCRSGLSRSGIVRVTERPSDPLSAIDGPNQRLAISNRVDKKASRPSLPGESDQVGTTVDRASVGENRRITVRGDRTPVEQAAAIASNESAGSPVRQATRSDLAQVDLSNADLPPIESSTPAKPAVDQSPLGSDEYNQIVKEFSDYSPEVQAEAMRRLMAGMAARATASQQPAAVTAALTDQLDHLPALPDVQPGSSDRRTSRLGAPPQRSKFAYSDTAPRPVEQVAMESSPNPHGRRRESFPANETITDDQTLSAKNTADPPTANSAMESQPATETLADVVRENASSASSFASSNHSDSSRSSVVQTASAILPDQDTRSRDVVSTAMVSNPAHSVLQKYDNGEWGQPSDDSPPRITTLESPLSEKSLNASPATALVDPLASADSAMLFASLVDKLRIAPENESEAARAGRLIKLRHLMVLSGDPDAAVADIEGLSESEQDYLRHQLMGLWTMVDPDGHPVPRRRLSAAVTDLRLATRYAAAASDTLEVRSLAFCTEIVSCGQFKPFKNTRFKAGQPVLLYVEVDNFTARSVDSGFEIYLRGDYDIFDSEGNRVVGQKLPQDKQISATYLRDYYFGIQMNLPSELDPGTYRLRLTMEDVNAKKYGQADLEFSIAK